MGSRPLIVCPLEFERKVLRRAGLEDVAELHCCGPGAAAVAAWSAKASAGASVILAGVAGGLDPDYAAGSAWVVTEVRSPGGEARVPPIRAQAPICVATSVPETVATIAGKQALAHDTGAHIVDLESVPFAHAADQRGWRWAIVRGISEDAATELPAGIDRWVDGSGRVRPAPLIADLCHRPGSLQTLRDLRRQSHQALVSVATQVRRLL